jgi:hypothetical protein
MSLERPPTTSSPTASAPSNDPDFAAKLEAIVGPYLDPPAHSLVLSLDEKSHVWMAPGSQEKS